MSDLAYISVEDEIIQSIFFYIESFVRVGYFN